MRKDPIYTITSVLTLAVCLGANTAILTIVNSVLLKPLLVPDSNRILLMGNQYSKARTGVTVFNNGGVPDYYDRLTVPDKITAVLMGHSSLY